MAGIFKKCMSLLSPEEEKEEKEEKGSNNRA